MTTNSFCVWSTFDSFWNETPSRKKEVFLFLMGNVPLLKREMLFITRRVWCQFRFQNTRHLHKHETYHRNINNSQCHIAQQRFFWIHLLGWKKVLIIQFLKFNTTALLYSKFIYVFVYYLCENVWIATMPRWYCMWPLGIPPPQTHPQNYKSRLLYFKWKCT